jgi:hypothetical protein
MDELPAFRVGPHTISLRRTAGRFTVSVDGRPVAGFFGTEAQAGGAALVAIAGRSREFDVVASGTTLACEPPSCHPEAGTPMSPRPLWR